MDPEGRSPSPEHQGVKFPRFGPDGQPLKAIIKSVDSQSFPPPSAHPSQLDIADLLCTLVSEEMQQKVVETVFESFDRYDQEKDIAMYVKKQFDRLYGTTWHCVIGKKWVCLPTSQMETDYSNRSRMMWKRDWQWHFLFEALEVLSLTVSITRFPMRWILLMKLQSPRILYISISAVSLSFSGRQRSRSTLFL